MRHPNTKCCVCGKEVYRRPGVMKKYKVCCSPECYHKHRTKYDAIKCKICGNDFNPSKATTEFCSRSCSNRGRKGKPYFRERYTGSTQRRFYILKDHFDFNNCMVHGCKYNTTFDIHRLIPGREGGKYEIGNMFAICPNHHAEIERGLIEVEKVDNFTLKIKNKIKKSAHRPNLRLNTGEKTKSCKSNICVGCGKAIWYPYQKCKRCKGLSQKTKIDWPPTDELIKMVEQSSLRAIGKKLGVADNSVKKRIKNHGIASLLSKAATPKVAEDNTLSS